AVPHGGRARTSCSSLLRTNDSRPDRRLSLAALKRLRLLRWQLLLPLLACRPQISAYTDNLYRSRARKRAATRLISAASARIKTVSVKGRSGFCPSAQFSSRRRLRSTSRTTLLLISTSPRVQL